MKNQPLSGIHRRIRQRLDTLDLTEAGASRKAGLDKTYLRKLFNRPASAPGGKALMQLAEALETTPEWLLTEPADGEPSSLPVETDIRAADVPPAYAATLPNDVPVMGTAAGSHLSGAFQYEGQVIEYVRRPPALSGVKDLFAIYIEGDSMFPEHPHGALRFVHPGRPARISDSVVVEIQNHEQGRIEATIGTLVKLTGTTITLGKLNPKATIDLKRQYVKSIHKVLTTNDLFGV